MNRTFAVAAAVLSGSLLTLPAADNYLLRLQHAVSQTRSNLASLTASAELAARQFDAGSSLWVAGRQEDFIAEACGRAGGLMAIAPLGQRVPGKNDVILYAVPGALTPEDVKLIAVWQQQGAKVIEFSSAARLYREQFPIDTVVNVVDLWKWTGEFVAACTRAGKMPILYQSYGLPGGPERGKRYQGKKFHEDLIIKPISAEVLGHKYLDEIERMLAKLTRSQMPSILQAARWWSPAQTATTLVTGHMFPRHAQDPRAPSLGSILAVPAWEDKDLLQPSQSPGFVLYLGYQFAPRKLIEQARTTGVKLVYSTVQSAQAPESRGNILYIDPGWPLSDGCVAVPGYDIPILPASGVMQAAIYWTIVSEGR